MGNIAYEETFITRSDPPSERQLAQWLPGRLRSLLPASWKARVEIEQTQDRGIDALALISAPGSQTAQVVIEIKASISPRNVFAISAMLARHTSQGVAALLVAPFISPRTQELLTTSGINYLDATGNIRLQLDRPALYIERQGATDSLWAETRIQHSLKGPAAGRVVRALCDFRPPYSLRTLAQDAETPPGTVSKILRLLDSEALIQRAKRGKYQGEIISVDWPALLQRWVRDYRFETANKVTAYLEPRGLDTLFAKLRDWRQASVPPDNRYSVTGSFAGILYAPIVQPRLLTLYVQNPDAMAARLELRLSERGANVLLAAPFDPVVFARATEREGVIYSAVTQIVADLLTGSGRSPQEGASLLVWMEKHEDEWRQ